MAILLLMSALISGSEVAYFSLTPADMHKLSGDDSKDSKRIIALKEKPRILLATILICNNFVNIAIVIISYLMTSELLSADTLERWAQGVTSILPIRLSIDQISSALEFCITIIGATFILVLFGEVTPKIYANVNNKRMARFMARPLSALTILLGPLSHILVQWASWFENRLGKDGDHLKNIKHDLDKAIELTVSHEQDSEKEIDILKSIVKFGDVSAKQIMRSRVDVIALDIESTFSEVLKTVTESGYSRIPVYEEDFDKIKGILYAKDLLIHLNEGDAYHWQKLIRTDVKFVPEAKKINELLKEFQQERTHMAIVVDEFGGSAGIATLEDVMEEVIGDIRDEFDEESEVDYEKLDNQNFVFEGKTLLNDMCRVLGIETDTFDKIKGDADSLAGLLLELLGRI
ncbi:MAG: gliding motility-associated protein GldE, partial [Saprospiraceae bacterium]|nr:gliding motility-associated protein GldE [Saprospiraceae bacterium]